MNKKLTLKERAKFIALLRKHGEVVDQIEMYSKKQPPYRRPEETIKKMAEWELYELADLTLRFKDSPKLDELKKKLHIIIEKL